MLLGRPEDDDWDGVIEEMVRVMDAVRKRGIARGVFRPQNRWHRRGTFFVLKDGVTKGPGSKVSRASFLCIFALAESSSWSLQKPGNLAHSKACRELLHLLLLNRAIRRIAGFQSSTSIHFFARILI